MDNPINSPETISQVETAPTNTDPVPVKTELVYEFPPEVKIQLCSSNICTNGHEWLPEIGLAKCPGCTAPLLAIKMVQCPVCNEPVAKFRLRSDHLPKGGVITPICRGSASMAEVTVMEVHRAHYLHEQENHKVREMPVKL